MNNTSTTYTNLSNASTTLQTNDSYFWKHMKVPMLTHKVNSNNTKCTPPRYKDKTPNLTTNFNRHKPPFSTTLQLPLHDHRRHINKHLNHTNSPLNKPLLNTMASYSNYAVKQKYGLR